MTTPVFDYPRDWYKFGNVSYRIQSRSQVANRTFLAGKNIKGPHAQAWVAQFTFDRLEDPMRQDVAAFFDSLDGQAGLLRISDPSRLRPWYDRNIIATTQTWTDGSRFTDSTLFESGFLPANLFVAVVANKGDKNLILGGLPVSTANVLRSGDLFQINPNGVPTSCPNCYQVRVGGSSDASGQLGVEIRPALRMNFAPGDQVSLRYPGGVFRLVDDEQGVIGLTTPVFGAGGFNLVEALDQIP